MFFRSLPAPGKNKILPGLSARGWVRQSGRQAEELYLDDLVKRGVLRRETRRLLGLLPYHRHPSGPGNLSAQARERFAQALAVDRNVRRNKASGGGGGDGGGSGGDG